MQETGVCGQPVHVCICTSFLGIITYHLWESSLITLPSCGLGLGFQLGWSSEHPGAAGGVPAHGRLWDGIQGPSNPTHSTTPHWALL